jgi:hypothetical protein
MSCTENPYEYANKQNTFYDPQTNQFLYGINNKMRATGVGDGTCNQINPLIFQDNYKCGLGSAGGNPCKKVIESFNSENSNHKVSDYITSIVLFFIIILIIYIYCNCSKSKNNKF